MTTTTTTEVRLDINDQYLYSASEIICCRICHEAEFETSKSLEAPCSCSGTVKFAHRDCVQRWCDEKGNTVCEICLQNFEPGYSAPPPKKPSQDTHVTIRDSLEASRRDENLVIIAIADEEESLVEREYAECSSTADATASMCRTLALINFEPGYSAPPPKKPSQDTHVTIRDSLEASRRDENLVIIAIADEEESLVEREYAECSSTADATASMCRTLALIFTVLLLARHFVEVLIGETGDYPFTLLTLLLIKACGILLPMYIIMRMIDMVHHSITRPYQDSERGNI